MKHIGCFSGGKDSTALMLWMREHIGVPGQDWTPVFCDTGWEHPVTYAYVQEINAKVLNGSLVTIASEKYPQGFVQLVVERKGIPGVRTRFCTQELKVFPLHAYFEKLDDEVTSYQGIRADESASRAAMTEKQWIDDAGGYWIHRPLIQWNVEQVFDLHRKHNIDPNPLYLMGSTRVGCWPCIMTGLAELKRLLVSTPDIRQRLIDLEAKVNSEVRKAKGPSTFFRSGTIPARFCSLQWETETCDNCDHKLHASGPCGIPDDDYPQIDRLCLCSESVPRVAHVPTAEDVFRYIESVDENQLPLLPAISCMSVYNLCE